MPTISNTRRNLYVDAEASQLGVAVGIHVLQKEAQRTRRSEAWLICPQQDQLGSSSMIYKVLGKQIMDLLRKRRPVAVEGVHLVAYTGRQLPPIGNGSPVVAIHTSSRLLDRVDALLQVPSLIVVPWNAELDTETWRAKWAPEIVRPLKNGPP
jgi:hypothetical protein